MPKIDFCFQGFVRGAEVTTVTNAEGEKVDVSKMTSVDLADGLDHGGLFLALGDYLYDNCKDVSIELFDFEEN
jgi:hypothetical protein